MAKNPQLNNKISEWEAAFHHSAEMSKKQDLLRKLNAWMHNVTPVLNQLDDNELVVQAEQVHFVFCMLRDEIARRKTTQSRIKLDEVKETVGRRMPKEPRQKRKPKKAMTKKEKAIAVYAETFGVSESEARKELGYE